MKRMGIMAVSPIFDVFMTWALVEYEYEEEREFDSESDSDYDY